MNKKTTFMEIMRLQPYGALMYDIVSIDGRGWEFSLFIKEDFEHMLLYGQKPTFEIVAGLFKEGRACPVVMIVNVNNNRSLLYETWLNHHAELGKNTFEYLANQDRIIVNLLNKDCVIIRSISIKKT